MPDHRGDDHPLHIEKALERLQGRDRPVRPRPSTPSRWGFNTAGPSSGRLKGGGIVSHADPTRKDRDQ